MLRRTVSAVLSLLLGVATAKVTSSCSPTTFKPHSATALPKTTRRAVADDTGALQPIQKEQRLAKKVLDVNSGGAVANSLPNALAGAAVFGLIEKVVKVGLKKADMNYPASLGACILLFAFLCVSDVVAPSASRKIYEALSPGAAILAKWFPVFFVPGLALLPLSPPIGGAVDIFKIVLTVVLGFVYSISTTLAGVIAVRKLQGRSPMIASAVPKPKAKSTSSPFSEEQWKLFKSASLVLGILSISATKLNLSDVTSPLQMLFTLVLTVTSYIWASRLPTAFTKVVHPLVTSSVVLLIMIRLLAEINVQNFRDILSTYKVGTLDPMKAGAGDYLLYILGPSVVSFALSVYSRKSLVFSNLPMVLTAMIVSSAGGLFATGAFVRLIQLGGSSQNAALVRLSTLGRNITTALAMALTDMVGGDLSIAAAVVCLTGIIGASYGIPLLNAIGIKDPVSRGLGIGSSSQGLGVASIAGEPDAFPFASVAMVLTAVSATTIASIPSARNALIRVTTGTAPIV